MTTEKPTILDKCLKANVGSAIIATGALIFMTLLIVNAFVPNSVSLGISVFITGLIWTGVIFLVILGIGLIIREDIKGYTDVAIAASVTIIFAAVFVLSINLDFVLGDFYHYNAWSIHDIGTAWYYHYDPSAHPEIEHLQARIWEFQIYTITFYLGIGMTVLTIILAIYKAIVRAY